MPKSPWEIWALHEDMLPELLYSSETIVCRAYYDIGYSSKVQSVQMDNFGVLTLGIGKIDIMRSYIRKRFGVMKGVNKRVNKATVKILFVYIYKMKESEFGM